MKNKKETYSYFTKNLIKGFIWLTIIVIFFITINKTVDKDQLEWLTPISSNPILVILIYSLSEIFFGIIPPELFMIWSLKQNGVVTYVEYVTLLFIISYGAGVLGFFFGRYLNKTIFFKYVSSKFLQKYMDKLRKYGMYLVIIAAVTPLPFSGICILVGSSNYSKRKFLLLATTRIVRFSVYAWIIYGAGKI